MEFMESDQAFVPAAIWDTWSATSSSSFALVVLFATPVGRISSSWDFKILAQGLFDAASGAVCSDAFAPSVCLLSGFCFP
jgi:hypothetical protein